MPSGRLLRHVVLIQFKAAAGPEQLTAIANAFLTLPDQITEIQSLEWGKAVGEPKPYTHCLLVTFHDEMGLRAYQDHSAHRAIVAAYGHLVESLVECDYWVGIV